MLHVRTKTHRVTRGALTHLNTQNSNQDRDLDVIGLNCEIQWIRVGEGFVPVSSAGLGSGVAVVQAPEIPNIAGLPGSITAVLDSNATPCM